MSDGNDRSADLADQRLEAIASALSIGGIERHVFVCAQPATPRCASSEDGAATWRALKSLLKATDLASPPPSWRGSDVDAPAPPTTPGTGRVLRTKVDCLRVCERGPIAVVYPDGVWYHSVTPEAVARVVQEHLIGGRVVEELVFARDPLRSGSDQRDGA